MADETYETDCVVIGAGVVGLAVAARLARAGREVIVLERNRRIGEETSARNSEVIHAGLYYPPGGAKAALCVRGRDMLYDWCAERGVAHRRIGKLIVAVEPEEEAALARISASVQAVGAPLEPLSGARARALEPALRVCAALHSPLTGVIDSHALMQSLLGEAEDHGASVALETPVLAGEITPRGVLLQTGGPAPARLLARQVVNAAGLWAPMLARRLAGAAPPPKTWFAKGNYFALTGCRAPFSRLIYPAPVAHGLGVHLTLDMAGQARFGPDVEPLAARDPDAIDYAVAPERADVFYAAIRRYWPGLPDNALRPDYAGARPKIESGDFELRLEADGALLQLYGVESPGLTAALAIAERIEHLLAA